MCGTLFEESGLCQVTLDKPYISISLSLLDSCRLKDGLVTLCTNCNISLQGNQISKFSGSNYINTTLCQEYPHELRDLTYIKECVIALAYPIRAIIKLTSSRRLSEIEYHRSQGHFITFKQDLF